MNPDARIGCKIFVELLEVAPQIDRECQCHIVIHQTSPGQQFCVRTFDSRGVSRRQVLYYLAHNWLCGPHNYLVRDDPFEPFRDCYRCGHPLIISSSQGFVLGIAYQCPTLSHAMKGANGVPPKANVQRTKNMNGSSFALKERRIFVEKFLGLLHHQIGRRNYNR